MLEDDDKRMFVLTRGLNNCLFAFPKTSWDERIANYLPRHMSKEEKYARIQALTSWSYNCVMDSQNRVKLPKSLAEYAGLDREVTIAGVNDRLELWDSKKYALHRAELEFDPQDIIIDTLI